MIRAYADSTTNNDWIVEQDGIRVARFSAFSRDSVFLAARLANKLRYG